MAEIPHNVQSAGLKSKISTKKSVKKKLVKSQYQSRAELTKLLRWDASNSTDFGANGNHTIGKTVPIED